MTICFNLEADQPNRRRSLLTLRSILQDQLLASTVDVELSVSASGFIEGSSQIGCYRYTNTGWVLVGFAMAWVLVDNALIVKCEFSEYGYFTAVVLNDGGGPSPIVDGPPPPSLSPPPGKMEPSYPSKLNRDSYQNVLRLL